MGYVADGLGGEDNKFEFQNPYQLRMADFVNETAIKRMVVEIGKACADCRADYVALMDDLPEGWSLHGVLSYVGLGALAGGAAEKERVKSPSPTIVDPSKVDFSVL